MVKMTQSLKCLGQTIVAPNALTTVYTVPADTTAAVSSLNFCNQSVCLVSFNVSIGLGGAADNAAQYLYVNTLVVPGVTFTLLLGITLSATDELRVSTVTSSRYMGPVVMSVSVFGAENS